MNNFSIGEALRFGWNTMKANFWFFVVVMLIFFGLELVLPGLMGGFSQSREFSMTEVVAGLVSGIFSIIIGIGLIRITLQFVDGQKPEYRELFAHANLFWKYLGAQILVNLVVALGFLLLIIPGIIWSIKYSFACYFVVDKGMGPIDAMKHSARITSGVKWQIFLFWITVVFMNIAGVLVLGIGLLATIPATMLAMTFVYRKLSERLEPAVVAAATGVQTSA